MKMDSLECIGFLGGEFVTNALKYLEENKELLKDPNFDCAYRIARTAFINLYFKTTGLDMVGNLYKYKLDSLNNYQKEYFEKDAYYLVDLVKRYNITNQFCDILDSFK